MRAVVLVLLVLMLGLNCFGGERRCEAQKLAQDEVMALKQIALKLKKQWNFSVDPCSGHAGWRTPWISKYEFSSVNCSCDATNVCHVINIELKSQNLTGELPSEFAKLINLNFIDLSRNYLNGSIPSVWASLPLKNLSLNGNRVSGRIPEELGNISTLESLVLEGNHLEGPIPPALGQLTNLTRLFLSANNFSGELPESLGNLKKMKDMRIDGNPISGKIPAFIGSWTQLLRLDMQGTNLQGPFPPNLFAKLSNLSELRVSDWKWGDGNFPPLNNTTKSMKQLVLRNLMITGQIPDYIGDMPLILLDLSFNNLSGTIPESFYNLRFIELMFLTNNLLQGSIPDWISTSKNSLDLSYNKFNGTPPSNCEKGNVNYVSSYSSTDSNVIPTCLRWNLPCSEKPLNFNLFINCGGSKVTIGDKEYEDDTSAVGPANYFQSQSGKWAYSSTGSFVVKEESKYIAENVSTLNMSNPELYTRARLSPLSLKYHGLCLQTGSYNVSLHFAEIIFTDDHSFLSVGRRLFDVSIQGVLPDGLLIAVKQLSSKSKQGNREFVNEIGMISAIQHPNLVKLYGCCTEGNQLLLIYEYMENNSLARALFGPKEGRLKLNWQTRRKICLEIARGLAYLHEESRIKIVHRDIKATNILLDKDLNAKISDFGLAKLDEQENTHISTRIAGTIGYMAPEYAMRGHLTDKADVYSFGVVMLEVVSGTSNTNYRTEGESTNLLDWAYALKEEGRLLELVDPNLGSNYSKEEALQMLDLSLICTSRSPILRPPMSMVVSILDGKIPVQALHRNPATVRNEEIMYKSFGNLSNHSQTRSITTDGPWTESSTSVQSRQEETLSS